MPAAKHNARWWSDRKVAAMYAKYKAGWNFVQIGKKWGVRNSSVRQAFVTRGLPLIPRANAGCYKTQRPLKSREEILRIISGQTAMKLPASLAYDWKKWTWAQRRWFLDQLKALRAPHKRRPTGPYSPGMVPFDYCTPEARAIVAKLNKGNDSRHNRTKLNLCSEGLIFEGQLWFWSWKLGRYSTGPYHGSTGRRACLHWHLYQRHHGPIPEGYVVRHADGNRNNFLPENLILQTRNDVVRENQASALNRKAQLHTAALLNRLTPSQP